ncbi:MAG TPA: hypothetical protein VFJ70_05540 [Burkholderiales bacterium]|nr:hypothetical protein [Burkholderiales bacterium]
MRILPVLLLAASSAVAAPFAVQVGDARLALDAPPGFADVQSTGSPRLFELAESLTSPSNRILLFALEDADVRRFSLGDSLELRRYVIVVTPKNLESARTTLAAFHALVADSLRELGSPEPPSTDIRQYLDSQARGRPGLIAELRKDQDVTAVLQGARLPDMPRSHEARYLLSTMTLMLVRGKPLNLALYTSYAGDADLEWIRGTTLRWIDELQRLNR